MKRFFTFMAVISFAVVAAFAQSITLKFTGATSGGRYMQMDSVRVQSMRRSWTETLVFPDTVLTLQQAGIADAQIADIPISIHPNPANGHTNVKVGIAQSGESTLQLYNLAGQCVAERTMMLVAGENHFDVRLQNASVYLLAVTTAQGRSTAKLLNRGTGAENSISFLGNGNVVEKRLSSNPFQSGDVLRIIGYASVYGSVLISAEVMQAQNSSENFTLLFSLPDPPVLPTVTTDTISNITESSATTGGRVTADGGAVVAARGVCWSTSQNPTVSGSHTTNGTGTGSFTSSLAGLAPGTTYYVRAYATNYAGTAYGSQMTFTTTVLVPTVTAVAATNITDSSFTTGGNVTSDGGSAVTARGVCWSTTNFPTISDIHTTDGTGTGTFASNLTGLAPGTNYYVRAYATNAAGTAYGNMQTVRTNIRPPVVATDSVFDITSSSATIICNMISDGGGNIYWRGVCLSTSPNPTLADIVVRNQTVVDTFSCVASGLAPGTTYYVRAYAINSMDTAYGNQLTFTTDITLPTVLIDRAVGVTDSTAGLISIITSDGGTAVTARGVCWSTTHQPTLSDSNTNAGTGAGPFSCRISGLTRGAIYYVRAYATNSVGTSYSNLLTFTPMSGDTGVTFSVSPDSAVVFSPGNLQWSATGGGSTPTTHTVSGGGTEAGTWRFAPNQWVFVGADNRYLSSTYTGWIDLFGFGTSGYNGKPPYMVSVIDTAYGNSGNDIYGTNYDWGVYNAIYNPKTSTTDAPGTWRTLTKSEWLYLMDTRATVSGIRFAIATVDSVPGLILVPDSWDGSVHTLSGPNVFNATFTSNIISSVQWTAMERAGCAFLPAAGGRWSGISGSNVVNVGLTGYYWLATHYNSTHGEYSYMVIFADDDLIHGFTKRNGFSVRLVKDVP